MYEKFDEWNPNQATLDLIAASENAVADMAGYDITLRTLYYQLVAANIIANKQSEYKRLGAILTKARNAGLFDWHAYEDKGRSAELPWSEEDPEVVLNGIEGLIQFDQWARQDVYVEVWVEKEAQAGVIKKACRAYNAPWMACKGYMSATASYDAGKRFRRATFADKRCVLIHLGDHDPSGIDMTRDNGARIMKYGETEVEVRRIALNMDQIEEHSLPPNPAKMTDSRVANYADLYGMDSWELDALKPKFIDDMVRAEIARLIDDEIWQKVKTEQNEMRANLEWIGDHAWEFLDTAQQEREASEE